MEGRERERERGREGIYRESGIYIYIYKERDMERGCKREIKSEGEIEVSR